MVMVDNGNNDNVDRYGGIIQIIIISCSCHSCNLACFFGGKALPQKVNETFAKRGPCSGAPESQPIHAAALDELQVQVPQRWRNMDKKNKIKQIKKCIERRTVVGRDCNTVSGRSSVFLTHPGD